MQVTTGSVAAPAANIQQSRLYFTLNIINTITHFLLGAVAFGAIYFANFLLSGNTLKQHIYCCIIGYVILMTQAILAINPHNSWSSILSHQDKKICHWVLQVVGSIVAIIGSILQITDKSITQHFNTGHGVLGIIAMILTILSLIGGAVNIYSSRLRLNITLVRVCHSILGATAIITAFLALCLGFHNLYRFAMGNINANLMISFTVVALIGTIMPMFIRILGKVCRS